MINDGDQRDDDPVSLLLEEHSSRVIGWSVLPYNQLGVSKYKLTCNK